MHAMALTRPKAGRVEPVEKTVPAPGPGQIAVTVRACGVCRTDLHVVDGDLPDRLPSLIVPGHEIVGLVEQRWRRCHGLRSPAIESASHGSATSCGQCEFCRADRENLCPNARFTGYQIDGGYAEHARRRRALLLPRCPSNYDD